MNGIKRYAFAYIDWLLFMMITMLVMFVISFMMMAKQMDGNVTSKAEFLIEMQWDDGSNQDIDLWVANPTGAILMYQSKDIAQMSLDRDDLGTNNRVEYNGQQYGSSERREVATIRSLIPGRYVVNALFFARRNDSPVTVTITVRKLNPYGEIHKSSKIGRAHV